MERDEELAIIAQALSLMESTRTLAAVEEDHRVCESIQAAALGGGVSEYVLGKLKFGLSEFRASIDALDGRFVRVGPRHRPQPAPMRSPALSAARQSWERSR